MASCPSVADLAALLAEDDAAPRRLDLETHLNDCTDCQQALLGLAGDTSEWSRLETSGAGRLTSPATEPAPEFLTQLKDALPRQLLLDGPHPSKRERPEIPGYDILDELGHGGTAVVYKARQQSLKRLVALKMVLVGRYAPPDQVARFRAEAEAVASLQHPNIVQIHEVGTADGLPYLSLEYVAGGSLAQQLRGARLEPRRAAELIAQVARAIHAAHQQGIIHRDLKPGNILLTETGIPKIADFGLARRLQEVDQRLTATDAVLGTPRYMAPEQARPRGEIEEVGPATDVHALGVVLYEALTGRPPFEAATAVETLLLVLHEEPLPPTRLHPPIPRDLETIVLKCLQKEPHRRYGSAQELARDLERFLAGDPIHARPVGDGERIWRYARRHPTIMALVFGLVAVTLLGLLGVSLALVEARTAQREENRQRLEADQARLQTQLALERSERSVYFGNIAQARSQWLLNNVQAAGQLLEKCPPALRGWEWQFLRNLNHNDLLTTSDAQCPLIFGMAYSPDGRWLAFGGGNPFSETEPGVVAVHDAQTGALRWRQHLRVLARCVCASPDGKWVAAGGSAWKSPQTGEFKVWDATDGTVVNTLPHHGSGVLSVAFRSDSQQLATGGGDHFVRIWDMSSGKQIQMARHDQPVLSVIFTPDHRFLISAGDDGTRVWDTRTMTQICAFPQIGAPSALSKDGRWLATSQKGGAVVWDLERLLKEPTGARTSSHLLHSFSGHTAPTMALAFQPQGQLLATASADGTVRTWDLQNGQDREIFRGHRGRAAALAMHPGGQSLASGGQQPGELKVWDLTRTQEYRLAINFGGERLDVEALSFADEGKTLLGLGTSGTLRTWNCLEGHLASDRFVDACKEWVSPGVTTTFSGDGLRLVGTTRGDRTILKVHDTRDGLERSVLRGHQLKVWQVASTWNGLRVASAAWEITGGRVKGERILWDALTGKALETLELPDARTLALAMNPDGSWLAEARQTVINKKSTWTVRLERVLGGADSKPLFLGPDVPVRALTFSADGRRLAAAYESNEVIIWNTTTGEALHPAPLPVPELIRALTFSPDGERLAGVSRDRVYLLDVSSGQDLLCLRGVEPSATDNGFNPRVAWSQDGLRLAASNWNRTVSVWDATDLATPEGKAELRRQAVLRTSNAARP